MPANGSHFEQCSFRTPDFFIVLEAFKNDHEFRLYSTIPAILLSPLIACSNGIVLVAILQSASKRSPAISLMCCLLCSDCLIGLVFLPLYSTWTINDRALNSCTLTGSLLFVGWLITTISFLTIIAVSIDRYVALFHPFKYNTIITSTRTNKLIVGLWIFSAIQSSMSLSHQLSILQYVIIGIILTVGLSVLIFTYTKIFKLVRHHHRQINSHRNHILNDQSRQMKLAIIMSYVIGVTLLCYSPFGIALAVLLVQGTFNKISFQYFHLCELLFSVSSLCNPAIYCIRNLEIRSDVMSLIGDIRSRLKHGEEQRNDHRELSFVAPATITLKRHTMPPVQGTAHAQY